MYFTNQLFALDSAVIKMQKIDFDFRGLLRIYENYLFPAD